MGHRELISWKPKQNKKAASSLGKGQCFLPNCLQTGTSAFFLPLDMNSSTRSSWGLRLLVLRWELNISYPGSQAFGLKLERDHQASWVSRLLTHSADLEACQAQNHVSQFLFLSNYIFPIGSVFLDSLIYYLCFVWEAFFWLYPLHLDLQSTCDWFFFFNLMYSNNF